MVFYAGKIILEPALENPTLVIITDRNDLDGQLFAQFAAAKDVLPTPVQAESREHLRELLQGRASGGIFFSTLADGYLQAGVPPEVLHRIVTIGSGGLDSLPHCGAIITTLTIMSLSHREAYRDIAVVTIAVEIPPASPLASAPCIN